MNASSLVRIVPSLAILVTLTAAGCEGKQEPSQAAPAPASAHAPSAPAASGGAAPAANPGATATPAQQPAQSAPAPTAQQVLATQPYNQNPDLHCEVMEVRRVSGGALLVRWRVVRPAASNSGLTSGQQPGIYLGFSWDAVYYTDPAENKKYMGLKDSAGTYLAQGENKTYAPGDQQMMWMKFPAPPATSNKITFVVAGFPPFEDLPVS